MARKDGAIKHTAVAEDGTQFTRMSPRTYTHAVLAKVTAQRVTWTEHQGAPNTVREGHVIEKAGSYTSQYDGKVSTWPTSYAGIVDIKPEWIIVSWHQGAANADAGYRAAQRTRELNYGAKPYAGTVKPRHYVKAYTPTHCGTWETVTLVEVKRG